MGGVDKVFAPLSGRPVLARVLDAFEQCGSVDRIVVVVNEASLEKCRRLAAQSSRTFRRTSRRTSCSTAIAAAAT